MEKEKNSEEITYEESVTQKSEDKKIDKKVKTKKAEEVKKNTKSKKKRKWRVLAFILFAVSVFYVIYRGEYLETLELGEQYLNVFWQNLGYHVITFCITFFISYFLIYTTNKRVKKGLVPFFEEEKKPIPKMLNKSIAFILAIVISFVATNFIIEKLMLFINSTAFGMTDPVLGYDIGYFIFGQPFLKFIIYYALAMVIGLTIYMSLYYIITFNFYFDGISRETLKRSALIKQICTNVIIIAFLMAGYIFIETHNVGIQKFLNLQESSSYALYGAGISEVTIKLWGYRILCLVIIISVITAVRAFKKQNNKKVIISLLAVPVYLVTMLVVLVGFELLFVKPNELDKQQSYIKANIENTKRAYQVDIEEVNLGENETVTTEQLKRNSQIVNNIAIVDQDMLLKNLNTLQTNKGYYTYRTAKIASYMVNGAQSLVYVSPREISSSTGTYNNKTYQYTHGYGAIFTSATSVDEKGNLIHLQKDFENKETNIISLTEPRIYFGLETNDTVVTNSGNNKEFDYPITTSTKAENAENTYSGKAGLSLNFIDRLILSMKEQDLKLAFSGNVDKDSKILVNRNIIERAKTLLPYILYDENPYIVTTKEGRLVWVLDGYTTSDNYPYSQRIRLQEENILEKTEINYIRNSVKVLVDAYDGTIQFYITDRNDPIIMAYQKLYKDLFVDKDITIPDDISSQFVYPQFLYQIQAQIMQRYHNIQTDVLYRGDDIWESATHNTGRVLTKTGTEMKPYYTMVKTTDNKQETLGLVLPYTPYEKQNLTAYLVGSYKDGEATLKLYKYPSDSNILGPMQIDTQLEQDERISSEIDSLNVTGTKITKNMIVVPIENSLLYVEPIYQQYINEENSTPILKKIVVASGNKVAIGNDMEEALKNLLSQYAVDIEVENTDTIEDLMQAIIKANSNLQKSNETNNWEMIGKDMGKLQELITKLETLVKKQEKEKAKNNKTNTENTIMNQSVNNMVNDL